MGYVLHAYFDFCYRISLSQVFISLIQCLSPRVCKYMYVFNILKQYYVKILMMKKWFLHFFIIVIITNYIFDRISTYAIIFALITKQNIFYMHVYAYINNACYNLCLILILLYCNIIDKIFSSIFSTPCYMY